jgi:hypothetical protein
MHLVNLTCLALTPVVPIQQIEADAGVERLNEVMQTIHAETLREINARLAAANPEFKRALALELVGVNAAPARAEPSYATCARCKDVYDVAEEREVGECVQHNGPLFHLTRTGSKQLAIDR